MEILRFNSQCVSCILGKFLNKARDGTDEVTKLDYARKLLKIIADADNSVSAPEIVAMATALKNKTFGFSDDFAEIKRYFNDLMLSKEPDFRASIENSADPFKTAVKFALLGNYIDFGAMYSVSEEKLNDLIDTVETAELDQKEFGNFLRDLEKAETLVYLTDNCGEIVLDKLLVEQIKRRFPNISVKVIVRGQPVLNDATEEDAAQVGLFDVTTVINNGTDIAGTCIKKLSEEARSLVENADVIISKGQGNFETLHHSGLNIYYIFLCKCDLFSDQFKVPKLTGMFLNDRRMSK
ncbi:MAG: DUF89 family protein [Clostridia bacterium]|nr:DUF89 family protein [Clostridia bacterium]